MKTNKVISVILCVAIIFSFTGCNKKQSTSVRFDEYLKNEFVESITSNSISLHFKLKDPSKFGITDFKPTFGTIEKEDAKTDVSDAKKELETLQKFDYKKLTAEQQETYDIIEHVVNLQIELAKYPYYGEAISPLLGAHAQLPSLLPEYNFYVKKDIDDYIALVNDTENYFEQIITYEKEKSKAGLFMNESSAQKVIDSCNKFVKTASSSALVTVFDKKVEAFEGLTSQEIKTYKEQNLKAIESMKKAYKNLADAMEKLKTTGKNDLGMCNFPKGKEYYEALVKYNVGSEKTVSQLLRAVESDISKGQRNVQKLIIKDKTLLEKYEKATTDVKTPTETVEALKTRMKEFYPELGDVKYEIKEVDKSLEDTTSPAFYLIPPIDGEIENVIYINNAHKGTDLNNFTTLAHEGYPGHLYQINYFASKKPNPIRQVLDFSGYIEGWATYAESQSYSMANLESEELAELMRIDSNFSMAISTRADIGVNYEGWDRAKLAEYFKEFGIEAAADDVFDAVIEEPANYLTYYCGYLEIMNLQETAKQELGDKFDLKAFNKAVLDVGPAPFKLVKESVNEYIETAKKAK